MYTMEDLEVILLRLETSLLPEVQRHQPNLHDFLGPSRRTNTHANGANGGYGRGSWRSRGGGRGRPQAGGPSYRSPQAYGQSGDGSSSLSFATGDRPPIISESILNDKGLSSSLHQTFPLASGSTSGAWRSQNQSRQNDGALRAEAVLESSPASVGGSAWNSPRTCDENQEMGVDQPHRNDPPSQREVGSEGNPIILD